MRKPVWNFGDGNYAYEDNPSHQYNAPGYYEVTLTISDSLQSCVSTWVEYIFVGEADCNADFSWSQNESSLTVDFTDQSTGDISYWFWSFGDGNYSELASPQHTYSSPGDYQVALFVADSLSVCSDFIETWITVEMGEQCMAGFEFSLDTLNNTPHVYQFTNTSTGNYTHWLWDFGDGNYSEEMNPTHTYEEAGEYQVCLEIVSNDSSSCSDYFCDSLSTLTYYNFGGHAFLGNYPLNVEEDDSANMAVASLYRKIDNQWHLMDTREFWKFGYYWFVEKPEGEYIIRTDLLPESVDYGYYTPTYSPDTRFWENANSFHLINSEDFAVDVRLWELAEMESGIGKISGNIRGDGSCIGELGTHGALVYLLNSLDEIVAFTYADELGYFEFNGVGYGTYSVRSEITGKLSTILTVELTATESDALGLDLQVNCNSVVGLEELTQLQNWNLESIYPQPASEIIYIELQQTQTNDLQIELFNINGNRIQQSKIYNSEGLSRTQINLEGLTPGLYLLRVSDLNDASYITRKIIVK